MFASRLSRALLKPLDSSSSSAATCALSLDFLIPPELELELELDRDEDEVVRDFEDEVVFGFKVVFCFGFGWADGGSWMFRPGLAAVGVAPPQLPSRLMRIWVMSILQADPAGP